MNDEPAPATSSRWLRLHAEACLPVVATLWTPLLEKVDPWDIVSAENAAMSVMQHMYPGRLAAMSLLDTSDDPDAVTKLMLGPSDHEDLGKILKVVLTEELAPYGELVAAIHSAAIVDGTVQLTESGFSFGPRECG